LEVDGSPFSSFRPVGPLDPLGFAELLKRLPFGSRYADLLKRLPEEAGVQGSTNITTVPTFFLNLA